MEGNVSLWEAVSGQHESVIKLLASNGAVIFSGDVGHFACTAVEQNNLDLLKNIVRYGGDVTLPNSNGHTALHTAVSDGNVEIVKFLLEQGADIDKPDTHGWTPRTMAEQQSHEEIRDLFQNRKEIKKPPVVKFSNTQRVVPSSGKPLMKYSSEPSMPPYSREALLPIPEVNWSDRRERRRVNNFQNSLFGIMSAVNTGEQITYFLFLRKKSYFSTCSFIPLNFFFYNRIVLAFSNYKFAELAKKMY